MPRHQTKRETDLQIITGWIREGQRVLDIGCGRGILLEHLERTLKVQGSGVDTDLSKIQACVKRGVTAYHGDAAAYLREFPDGFFDWIIMSRMVQELNHPGEIIRESLRVADHVAVGFVNQGYWVNRWATLVSGSRPTNVVFPLSWEEGSPYNPVTVRGFEEFTARHDIYIENSVFLQGDWKTRCVFLPNLLAGYALFHLKSNRGPRSS